jgi:GNAT superfamily N-acetyltransferase
MALVEVTWAVDRLSLYDQLEAENRDESHAVRHMLWYLISGRIKEGSVYVDQWPSVTHVCCLHPTTIYTSSDRDFIVLFTNDLKTFGQFLNKLVVERRWSERDGVVLAYVEENAADIATRILCPDSNHGSIWMSQPLRHYTAYERKNFEVYARDFDKYNSKLPSDLHISKLKPEEAGLVAEYWPYDLPDKTDMFRWLITTFPSTCTRDRQGKPVAWAISYSFGATGGAYVLPEYRGKGVHEAQVSHLLIEILRINPGLRFFWIVDDNIASLRQAKRSAIDMRQTDKMMKMVAYITPKGQKIKARL